MSIYTYWDSEGDREYIDREGVGHGQRQLLDLYTEIDGRRHVAELYRYRYMQDGGGRLSLIPVDLIDESQIYLRLNDLPESQYNFELTPDWNTDMFRGQFTDNLKFTDSAGRIGFIALHLDNSEDYYFVD